jgi:energy-coupling factor transport system substrate-specific component
MTWETASFLVLGAVLLSGFAWYERSRPPSQVVALVAALAALAIAGRIAFAAFPNVKPTTDIVLFAGYALGAAPGFAVGALTALVSNIWFGQGPWTPWQMAGWGMCGLFGAALALGGRNASRLTLAAACGLAGIAYGVLLNFSLMATYGGEFSLQRFLLLESRAVPFDAAHAIGNVVLALVAGPAMVRMLVRFRERFEWRAPAFAGSALLALALVVSLPATAGAASADAQRAAGWLESVQNRDGGFGGSQQDASSTSTTAWVALGLAAAGRNPLDVERDGHTPIDYLRANVENLGSPGDFARTILALEAAGVDPRSFGGRNLVAALLERRASNGSWVGWPGSTAFAVIALRTAGATGSLDHSLSWLAKAQNPDGGWGDLPQPPSTADGTGAVMQAMPDSDIALQGLAYLRHHQREGGGFVTGASGAVNSQSTAWAVQGILAVGGDPASVQAGGESPLDYLADRQAKDGHYRYSADSDQTPIWVTGQVLVAVSRKHFPVSTPPRKKDEPESAAGKVEPTPGSSSAPETPSLTPPSAGSGTESPPSPGGLAPSGPPALGAPAIPSSPGGGQESEEPGAAPLPSPASQPVATVDDPSPAAPLGIGLAAAGLALVLPWWLGRRYGW